jgi:hypothetical protein
VSFLPGEASNRDILQRQLHATRPPLSASRLTAKALKLARCQHSLFASQATSPSMSLIPFAPFASRQPPRQRCIVTGL